MTRPRALIADDEPLLREALARQLATAWPELEIVAQARNGREAVKQFEGVIHHHLPTLGGQGHRYLVGLKKHIGNRVSFPR